MKKKAIGLLASLFYSSMFAQQKEFEGILVYRVEIKSKSDLISDRVFKNILAVGNETTVWVKQGNYKQTSGISTTYYITKDQKAYIKFNSLDTLYYVDYSADTSAVTNVSKTEEKRNIAGFECKSITIQQSNTVRKYYYAPALYMNPEYDKNNTIGRYDVFAKETSSLYLDCAEENKSYSFQLTCFRLQQTAIADSVFDLPKLPRKKFSIDELTIPAEYTKSGGWEKYLQANINTELAPKYIKVPKGEEKASETVYIKFLVNEYGKVVKATVDNPKEVHSKLAEEALRVVNESPLWKPATIYGGEKTIFWLRIPITFEVIKK